MSANPGWVVFVLVVSVAIAAVAGRRLGAVAVGLLRFFGFAGIFRGVRRPAMRWLALLLCA